MIVIKAKYAKSWKEKIVGLLGTKTPQPLFFQTRFGIHTFGMKPPIDVVILDKNYTVVACKANLLPNRIFLWNPLYKNVLELPKGEIRRLKIEKGQKITLLVL